MIITVKLHGLWNKTQVVLNWQRVGQIRAHVSSIRIKIKS